MAVSSDSAPKAHICEECFFFDYLYDDDSGEMGCTASMDEDEMASVIASGRKSCPYYRYHDEYKIVQKQN